MRILKKNNQYLIEIYFITATLLFYLLRTAIPLFKFPFLFLFVLLIIYSIVKFRNQLSSSLNSIVRGFYLLFILLIILTISFFLSEKLYLTIFKDILNSIILISIFLILTLYLKTKTHLENFISSFYHLLIFFAFILSINAMLTLFNIYYGSESSIHYGFTLQSDSSVLEIDNNFATLPVVLALITVLYCVINTDSIYYLIVYNLLLIVYSLSIFFSGSRRAVLFLSISIILIFLLQFHL